MLRKDTRKISPFLPTPLFLWGNWKFWTHLLGKISKTRPLIKGEVPTVHCHGKFFFLEQLPKHSIRQPKHNVKRFNITLLMSSLENILLINQFYTTALFLYSLSYKEDWHEAPQQLECFVKLATENQLKFSLKYVVLSHVCFKLEELKALTN